MSLRAYVRINVCMIGILSNFSQLLTLGKMGVFDRSTCDGFVYKNVMLSLLIFSVLCFSD